MTRKAMTRPSPRPHATETPQRCSGGRAYRSARAAQTPAHRADLRLAGASSGSKSVRVPVDLCILVAAHRAMREIFRFDWQIRREANAVPESMRTTPTKLESDDGAELTLLPVRDEFDGQTIDQFDDFIVVTAQVRLADGHTRTFTDAALLATEAAQIPSWLRNVRSEPASAPEPDPDDWDEAAMLTFLEPVIAFSLASHHGDHSVVRVHFTLEGLPPWDDEETFHHFVVPLQLDHAQCRAAAAHWEHDSFPSRCVPARSRPHITEAGLPGTASSP